MWNETFHPLSDELLEQQLQGNKYTDAEKDDARAQVKAANEAGIRSYKVHITGLQDEYFEVLNGEVIGSGSRR